MRWRRSGRRKSRSDRRAAGAGADRQTRSDRLNIAVTGLRTNPGIVDGKEDEIGPAAAESAAQSVRRLGRVLGQAQQMGHRRLDQPGPGSDAGIGPVQPRHAQRNRPRYGRLRAIGLRRTPADALQCPLRKPGPTRQPEKSSSLASDRPNASVRDDHQTTRRRWNQRTQKLKVSQRCVASRAGTAGSVLSNRKWPIYDVEASTQTPQLDSSLRGREDGLCPQSFCRIRLDRKTAALAREERRCKLKRLAALLTSKEAPAHPLILVERRPDDHDGRIGRQKLPSLRPDILQRYCVDQRGAVFDIVHGQIIAL